MMANFEQHVDAFNSIHVLKQEIEILKTRIRPSATGHIHTTISVLEDRIKEHEEIINGEIQE